MKILLPVIIVLLTGCSTAVPIKQTFPKAPASLMAACPELYQVENTDKLSDVLTVVTRNYSQYHECRIKVDAWIEWYKTQQPLFDK
jgi:hypothetical protein